MARILRGHGAAGGVAVGSALTAWSLEADVPASGGGEEDQVRALDALSRLADRLGDLAARARRKGRIDVADVLDANRLMATDPALSRSVRLHAADVSAVEAIRRATEEHAVLLEETCDPLLAERANDVRGLGRRAAALLMTNPALTIPDRPTVLLATDLAPADVAELELTEEGWVCGVALIGGTPTSHVTIMARSLGLPVAVAIGPELLTIADGDRVVIDGDRGLVVVDADDDTYRGAHAATERIQHARSVLAAYRHLPAVTRDGRRVGLLCNASTEPEIAAGLATGAEGVGLLRSEMAFLEATAWPSEADHLAFLEGIVMTAGSTPLTVRTLDFGADKLPPFLRDTHQRGLALALTEPMGLAAQLRAILRVGTAGRLRILFPFVEDPDDVVAALELLRDAATHIGWSGDLPPVGAMIETVRGVERAADIATLVDFLSIGTNDLVSDVLGAERDQQPTSAADPAVLSLLRRVTDLAERIGVPAGVCGEAAGIPSLAVLLVGLGVEELSVSPVLVDGVRATVRSMSAAQAAVTADTAVHATSAELALAQAHRLLSAELRQELGELSDRLDGIVA